MIFIGLGSSIGDAKKIFSSVEKSMRKIGIEVLQKSKFIKSSPLGGVAKK
jgi:7,8-dihydro-6-hydroxymethylpterin-pyrophosphokinase